MTERRSVERRAIKPVVGVVAAAALVAALLAPTAAAADERPVRERFGTDEPRYDVPEDGGVVETTTPTLEYGGGYHGAEIVVDAGRGITAGSGLVRGGEWVVTDGALAPGGSYEWHVVAPLASPIVGLGAPTIDRNGNVSGDMAFGSRFIKHTQAQAPQSFEVATGVGAPTAAAGLTTDFFPHYDLATQMELDDDGNPVEDIPPTVLPGPGAETVNETATWDVELDDNNIDTCRYERRLTGEELSRILCEFAYHIDATATMSDEAGHAAAHNVAGENVAPSFSMVVTEDQAIEDGFLLSTRGNDRISAAFPLQTEFGFRSLGYLEVPETGTYRFGTQSPGGAELVIYDTTETDLGKTEISHPDAWWPTTLGEDYAASTNQLEFSNRYLGGWDIISDPWGGTIVRYRFEYGPNDASWFQAPDDVVRDLTESLRTSGPRADDVRWGEEVHLEAGRKYPLVFTGWVGAINGDIGIQVDSDATGQIHLPFEWLTAAPHGTIDFDRELSEPGITSIDGVAFAVSGHGDTLASLDAIGDLQFLETDGAHGWRAVDTIPHFGFAMPPEVSGASSPQALVFNDEGTTLVVAADRWPSHEPADPETVRTSYSFVEWNKDLEGTLRGWSIGPRLIADGHRYTLEQPFWIEVMQPSGTRIWLDVYEIGLRLGGNGEILDAAVTGTARVDGTTHPVDALSGHVDLATGDVHLDFVSGSATYGMVIAERGTEPGPPSQLPSQLDVALVDKVDDGAPWSADNIATTSLNELLDAAGIERPWVDDTLPYSFTTFGSHAVSGMTVDDDAVQLEGSLARDLGGGHSDPLWGSAWRLSITLNDLSLHREGDAFTGGSVQGSYMVDMGPPGARTVYEFEEVLGGSIDPVTGEIVVDVSVHSHGTYRGDTQLVFAPDTFEIPQAVETTSAGNTVAVLQPVGADHRVVVVDRPDDGAPWEVVETLVVSSDASVAVGQDRDLRFLAVAEGGTVTVYEWTTGQGDWRQVETLAVEGAVGSLSLDYFAEHLAVGQPDIGRVTVFERHWSASDWTHQTDLDGDPGFGAELRYTWQMLTVWDSNQSLIRIYRDHGYQPWTTYDDWVQGHVSGTGSELVTSTGGSPHFHRSVSTMVGLGEPYAELSTHLG